MKPTATHQTPPAPGSSPSRRSTLGDLDLPAIVAGLAPKWSRFPREDVEEAVATGALEIFALAEREPLEGPPAALIRQRAQWNMLSRAERAPEVSIDRAADDPDRAPVDVAIDVDFDGHARLREARDNPVLRRRLAAAKVGVPELRRRGSANTTRGKAWSDEVVAEVRYLWSEGVAYAQITALTGVPQGTISNWVVNGKRSTPTIPGWSRAAIVQAFRAFAKEEGRSPKSTDAVDPRLPTYPTVYDFFGGWLPALEAAGLSRAGRSRG